KLLELRSRVVERVSFGVEHDELRQEPVPFCLDGTFLREYPRLADRRRLGFGIDVRDQPCLRLRRFGETPHRLLTSFPSPEAPVTNPLESPMLALRAAL